MTDLDSFVDNSVEKVENPCEIACVCTRCGAGAQHTGAPVTARLSGLFLGLFLDLFLSVYMQMQMLMCLHLHLLLYLCLNLNLYLYMYMYMVFLVYVGIPSYVFVYGMASNAYRCLRMLNTYRSA